MALVRERRLERGGGGESTQGFSICAESTVSVTRVPCEKCPFHYTLFIYWQLAEHSQESKGWWPACHREAGSGCRFLCVGRGEQVAVERGYNDEYMAVGFRCRERKPGGSQDSASGGPLARPSHGACVPPP